MKIQYNDEIIEMSDEFSFNKGNSFDIPDGSNVYATVFSQETPDTNVFRSDMRGVTFYNCHLDNCIIPEGNTVIGGSQIRFELQKDGRDWEIDDNNKPVKVINEKEWLMGGYSVDVQDIPEHPTDTKIISKLEYEQSFGDGNIPENSSFVTIPNIIREWTDEKVLITKKENQLDGFYDVEELDGNEKIKNNDLKIVKAKINMVEIEGEVRVAPLEQIKKIL